MNNIVTGWLMASVIFGAVSVLIGGVFGRPAGTWFFAGSIAVIVTSMLVVGFSRSVPKQKKGD